MTLSGLSMPSSSMSLDTCKARYGIAYVRAICSQAGVPFNENEQDEDVLAIDCEVKFPQASVRVQVKCTSRWRITGKSISWPVEDKWVRKWEANEVPVYFVVVIVPARLDQWLRHDPSGTFHRTAAYWVRLQRGTITTRVKVPKEQRLTAATIADWHRDLLSVFRLGGTS